MAISNRGEMGVGGGSRGGSGGSGVRKAFINNGVRKAANGKQGSSSGITGTGSTPIKINSAVKATPPTKATARGIAAANKPVSRKNAGKTGGKFTVDILKNASPARANRTRDGKKVTK